MFRRFPFRYTGFAVASLSVLALTAAASSAARVSFRQNLTEFLCEHDFIAYSNCARDEGGHSFYDGILQEMLEKEEFERQLAPIIAEQNKIIASQRSWEDNKKTHDRALLYQIVIGCERDKLAQMQLGNDVSAWDCRKPAKY